MTGERDTTVVALERIEQEITEIKRAFKGDEFSEQPGLLIRVRNIEDDVNTIKSDRAAEKNEREGMKKLLQWVGATSIFSVLTMMAVIVTLIVSLQGVAT